MKCSCPRFVNTWIDYASSVTSAAGASAAFSLLTSVEPFLSTFSSDTASTAGASSSAAVSGEDLESDAPSREDGVSSLLASAAGGSRAGASAAGESAAVAPAEPLVSRSRASIWRFAFAMF